MVLFAVMFVLGLVAGGILIRHISKLLNFLDDLAKVKGEWYLGVYSDHLRVLKDTYTFCPITAVCADKNLGVFETSSYHSAARRLGLPQYMAQWIADAADNCVSSKGPLRQALKKATRL